MCAVKSWPGSKVHWNCYNSIYGTAAEKKTSERENEVIVSSTMTLPNIYSSYDGKKCTCTVEPMYGKTIKRTFTLSVENGEAITFSCIVSI